VSIKGREELGQNVTKGIGVGAVPPPTPHVHEVVPKRMKTEGLNTIGNEPYVRKRLKEKGMLEGVNEETRERARGGFSSDQPRET
jgi:hypothetical protein